MGNEYLQDPKFWEQVEGEDLEDLIATLSKIPEPSKRDKKLLLKAQYQLEKVQAEAERLAALNTKWQTGHLQKDPVRPIGTGIALPEADSIALFAGSPVEPERDPSKLYCSFCKKEVQSITATRGTGKVRSERITDPIIDWDGECIGIDEKVIIRADKVIACPSCAHLVKKVSVVTSV